MADNNNNNNNNNENEEDKGKTYPGLFNFQGVMNEFYAYKPDKDDDEGRAMKNAFASNMVQSAWDKEMAKEMGEYQNALGQSNMQLAANLELTNNSSMMQQEFNYGMQSMGAQFDFQNEFANAQFDRDIATLAATGEDTRKSQDNVGFNNRLQTITEGEQARLTDVNRISETGKETRLTDTNKAQVEGDQQRLSMAVQGGEQRLTDTNKLTVGGNEARKTQQEAAAQRRDELVVAGDQERQTDTNRLRTTGEETRANLYVQGSEQRLTDTNKIMMTGSEQRLTDTNRINVTGKDTRKTMGEAQRLESKTRAEQHKYARGTARSF